MGLHWKYLEKNHAFYFTLWHASLQGTYEWAVAWGYLLLYFWTASIWEWSQAEVRKRELKIPHDSEFLKIVLEDSDALSISKFLCAAHRLSFAVLWSIKFKYHEPHPPKRQSMCTFCLCKFCIHSMGKSIRSLFSSLKGLIMLLFQQWFHIRDNFYSFQCTEDVFNKQKLCLFKW